MGIYIINDTSHKIKVTWAYYYSGWYKKNQVKNANRRTLVKRLKRMKGSISAG